MKEPTGLAFRNKRFFLGLLMTFVILLTSASQGQEWTRFRGPNGQGISSAKDIPVKWTEDDYNWKVELPGGGHSSPVLWGEKVFVTTGDRKTNRGILLALHASDGRVLWQKQYPLTKYRMNRQNSYATATPTVDADHVYALWLTSDESILVALDHNGREIWKSTFAGVHCQHGAGTSPVVVHDTVVFTLEHEVNGAPAHSEWIAVDRKTGLARWKLKRDACPKTSYSSPCVYSPRADTPQLIFTSMAHGITAVNPRSGQVSWEVKSAFVSRVISSPVIAGDLLIGTCGDASYGKRLIAIRPGRGLESDQPQQAYKIDDSAMPYVPTSLAKDGLLFTFHDRGYVACLRSATGEQIWREKPAGKFYGSPVWVDGRLYCMTIPGEVVVLKAAPTYELLAINPLGEKSHTTPAVAGDRMYLRTYSHVICIGPKALSDSSQ